MVQSRKHEFPPDVWAMAERAFQGLQPLNPEESCLLILGIGSGALLARVLEEYGHASLEEFVPQPHQLYSMAECRPWRCLSIWVYEPNPKVVEWAINHFQWHKAISCGQMQFFTGPHALDEMDRAIREYIQIPPTSWSVSPDTSLSQSEIQIAVAHLGASIHHRLQQRKQGAEQQAKRFQFERSKLGAQPLTRCWCEVFSTGKRLKILVLGTRYGAFVGHSSASLSRSFERMGHTVHLLRETNDFQMVTPDLVQQTVMEMNPELIVSINYSRSEMARRGIGTDGIPYLCWIQDPPQEILYKPESIAATSELDFYFSSGEDWAKELQSLGYGEIPVVKVPTDPELYSKHPTNGSAPHDLLSRLPASIEISFVSTISAEAVQNQFGDPLQSGLDLIQQLMFQEAYRQMEQRLVAGKPPLLPDEYRQIVLTTLQQINPAYLEPKPEYQRAIEQLTLKLEAQPGRVALRGLPIVWLIEAGYHVGLFGNGWQAHPILGPHTLGMIPYGKPMAAMLRASQVHVCCHGIWTLTMKVLDCLATETFPLVQWVDPARDTGPITEWYQEDRDIVLFRTRDELLDKTRYYLTHPEERQAIARRGREITLKHFTYDRLAETMLTHIRRRLGAE